MKNVNWEPIACEKLILPDDTAEIVSTSVDLQGNALVLTANPHDQSQAHETETRGIGIFPKSRAAADLHYTLTVQKGTVASASALPPLDITFPFFDRFSDGGGCLVGARCSWRAENDFDLNAAMIGTDSTRAQRFCFGDGIEGLGIDAQDRIWVSYFDEGVFGNFGWSNPGPTGLGAGGLNCFDRQGQLLWQHNHDGATEFIDDCYALNVGPNGVWFYFYSAFKMATVHPDFSVQYFDTPIGGAAAFVTDGHRFVFSSQYREPPTSFHATNLYKGSLVHRRKLTLDLPTGVNADRLRMIAKSDRLHVFSGLDWLIYDLASLDYG